MYFLRSLVLRHKSSEDHSKPICEGVQSSKILSFFLKKNRGKKSKLNFQGSTWTKKSRIKSKNSINKIGPRNEVARVDPSFRGPILFMESVYFILDFFVHILLCQR